ncbi:MAG: nickel-dependent hydrogenase large subunit [Candidatus Diapherotrites archaeon]|nr:nickel-dependent hydrogenase large subunit [Candidatus Diapherotrites archaeon]
MRLSEKKKCSIAIGPIHPALKEPIQIEVKIEGEKVTDVDFALGHVHRGIEWIGLRRNPLQILYLAERVCGICNISHPLAFCTAIENAANIKVPERAEYLRVIYAELERIHSHLLFLGVAAHELGFDSILHYTWLVREKVLDIIEYLTGNRITKAVLMIGGIRRDITKEQIPKIKETLKYYEKIYKKLCDIFLDDPTIKLRTRDIGVLTKEQALKLCIVGPTARASGVKKDIRQDFPYAAYADLKIEAITPATLLNEIRGDVFDRVIVRLLEVKQSMDIIKRCLKEMPEGPIMYEPVLQKLLVELKQVSNEGVALVEAPRGELIHYIRMKNSEAPVVWKIRAPTYANMHAIPAILKDCQLADVPIVVASIDPCISCANRAIVADKNNIVLNQEKLHELSVKKTLALTKDKVKGEGND